MVQNGEEATGRTAHPRHSAPSLVAGIRLLRVREAALLRAVGEGSYAEETPSDTGKTGRGALGLIGLRGQEVELWDS